MRRLDLKVPGAGADVLPPPKGLPPLFGVVVAARRSGAQRAGGERAEEQGDDEEEEGGPEEGSGGRQCRVSKRKGIEDCRMGALEGPFRAPKRGPWGPQRGTLGPPKMLLYSPYVH